MSEKFRTRRHGVTGATVHAASGGDCLEVCGCCGGDVERWCREYYGSSAGEVLGETVKRGVRFLGAEERAGAELEKVG